MKTTTTAFLGMALAAVVGLAGAHEQHITLTLPDGQAWSGKRCGTPTPSAAEIAAAAESIGSRAGLSLPCTVTVPVAFHILRHDNGITGEVPNSQIMDQLDVLNAAYLGMGFQFELLTIDRIDNTVWAQMDTTQAEMQAKQALAIDPAHVLNVYTCTSCQGYLGWAYFPFSFPESDYRHGVVALYGSFPGGGATPYDEGDTVTHEVGHYLGLFHTFQGGCAAPGDSVDDTPYEAEPAFGCPVGRDTCPAAGLDPIYNFMDYTDDACMIEFTTDQSERMQAMVDAYRPSLVNCSADGFPDVVFTDEDGGMVFAKVADMGDILGNEWHITVKNDIALSGPWAVAMSYFNPEYREFSIAVLADDRWLGHSFTGIWDGDGSIGYASLIGALDTWVMTLSPPALQGTEDEGEAPTLR